jgi:hypothetical protein
MKATTKQISYAKALIQQKIDKRVYAQYALDALKTADVAKLDREQMSSLIDALKAGSPSSETLGKLLGITIKAPVSTQTINPFMSYMPASAVAALTFEQKIEREAAAQQLDLNNARLAYHNWKRDFVSKQRHEAKMREEAHKRYIAKMTKWANDIADTDWHAAEYVYNPADGAYARIEAAIVKRFKKAEHLMVCKTKTGIVFRWHDPRQMSEAQENFILDMMGRFDMTLGYESRKAKLERYFEAAQWIDVWFMWKRGEIIEAAFREITKLDIYVSTFDEMSDHNL